MVQELNHVLVENDGDVEDEAEGMSMGMSSQSRDFEALEIKHPLIDKRLGKFRGMKG